MTNDLGYNVMLACQLILTTSASATTGLEISEANGENITPGNHHAVDESNGTYTVTAALKAAFVNAVCYAASDAAPPTGANVATEQDYGRLWAIIL